MTKHNPTSKRYLRKRHLRERYGDTTDRTIERMVADGRLPKPTMYSGRNPLWDEAVLDAHDRHAVLKYANKQQDRAAAPAT